MLLKLLTSRVGNGSFYNAGDLIDVGDAEASRMIAAGQAERVEPAEARVENAMLNRAGGRKPRPEHATN